MQHHPGIAARTARHPASWRWTRFSQHTIRTLCLALSLIGFAGTADADENLLEEKLLQRVEQRYGAAARARLEQLVVFMHRSDFGNSEMAKLRAVNDFFNRVPFIDDPLHWKKDDYWATPIEKLASNGGDCEDFAIAKFFALKRLGVPEDKLRMTYAKSITLKQAHMVITYFPTPDAMPLVLDNINPKILPASERDDLVPVYSFNGDSLWIAKSRGAGKRVGSAKKVTAWQELLQRMDGLEL